MLIKYSLLVVT